jgi:hypothetical protein
MQDAQAKRQIATSIFVSAALLYGCIFFVNWLSPKACSTAFWPPSIHCEWEF